MPCAKIGEEGKPEEGKSSPSFKKRKGDSDVEETSNSK